MGRIAQESATRTDYFLPDALGSVRQLATEEGNISLTQSFDPFGSLRAGRAAGFSSYSFAGEWADPSGLQYLRSRYYAPSQGRFLTRDPFSGFLSQPATLQPYQYVVNNPVLLTDPSGDIAPILLLAGAGFIAGALFDVWQQTQGFTNWCHFDVMESLAWGVGGAAAVSWFAIMSVGAIGLAGMGFQGITLGFYGLGFSGSITTSLWVGGIAFVNASTIASTWLFTNLSTTYYPTNTRGGAEPIRIGQAGVRHVTNLLTQAGETIVRQPAYYETPMGRAFPDIETQNFLIEVKNVANPTLSAPFRDQFLKYLEAAQQIGKPLQYYFTNQPPNESIVKYFELWKIKWFHTPIP